MNINKLSDEYFKKYEEYCENNHLKEDEEMNGVQKLEKIYITLDFYQYNSKMNWKDLEYVKYMLGDIEELQEAIEEFNEYTREKELNFLNKCYRISMQIYKQLPKSGQEAFNIFYIELTGTYFLYPEPFEMALLKFKN